MATIIQIKRTTGLTAPTSVELAEGELAYTQDRTNEGAGSKLYIESVSSLGAEVIHTVGGKFYTDVVDGATPTPANFKIGNGATSGGQVELYEDTDNGVNYTGFKSPDALAADVMYVLPLADGASGQQLQTNGSAVLSWQNSTATIAGADDTDITSEASGELLIWDGTNSWDNVAMSGDVTITNLGATTIGALTIETGMLEDNVVTLDKIADEVWVTEAEGIAGNDNDTTLPTSAAVKDYVDTLVTAQDLDTAGDTGTGSVDLDSQSLSISGTANNIVTVAGAQGVTLALTADVDITTSLDVPTLGVSVGATLASAIVSDLTNNRIVVAGTAGELEDDANFTMDGTNFQVGGALFDVVVASGNTTIGGTLDVTGDFDVNSGQFTVNATNGNTVVNGDLTVNGTTTTVNSTTVQIDDPIFEIGESTTDDNLDRGIKFLYNDGAAKIGFFGYDDSAGKFIALTTATDTASVMSGTAMPALFGNIEGVDIDASGTLTSTGNFDVNGSQFTVDSTNGNTVVAGTLDVTGSVSLTDKIDLYNNAAPTDGQLLIGHTSNGTFETSTLTAGEGIDITNAGGSITIDGEDASASNKGIASFAASYFTVTAGDVEINDATVTTKGIASFATANFTLTSGAVAITGIDGGTY